MRIIVIFVVNLLFSLFLWGQDWHVQNQFELCYKVNETLHNYPLIQKVVVSTKTNESQDMSVSVQSQNLDTSVWLFIEPRINGQIPNGIIYEPLTYLDSFFISRGVFMDNLLYNGMDLTNSPPCCETHHPLGMPYFEKDRRFRRLFISGDTITLKEIDKDELLKEESIYGFFLDHIGTDLFYIHKDSFGYSKKEYRVDYNAEKEGYYTFKLDTINRTIYNPSYPIYYYWVKGKYEYQYKKYGYPIVNSLNIINFAHNCCREYETIWDKHFLYLGFCPKIGIVSYYFPQAQISINLESIDGKPLFYYVKNNICITPFCEIK